MLSQYIVRNLFPEQILTNFQIYIAIDPKELLTTSLNLGKTISILKELASYPVNISIQTVMDEDELENYYISDNRSGPGIIITVADSKHAMLAKDYKNMLLLLWLQFQILKIPLQHYIGAKYTAIPGPEGFPSPFFLRTQQNTKHPILAVKFDAADLENSGIQFDYKNYLDKFHSEMNKQLNEEVRQVKSVKILYRCILSDDEYIQKRFIEKIKVYKTILLHLQKKYGGDGGCEEAYMNLVAKYQIFFATKCHNDKKMQTFIHYYPRNEDETLDGDIVRLRNLQQLSESEILFIVKRMRENYENKILSLKKEFNKFFDDLKLPTEQNPHCLEYAKICRHIKNKLALLIEKNPSKMQLVLAQLKRAYQEYQMSQFKYLDSSSTNNHATIVKSSYFYSTASSVASLFHHVIKPTIPASVKEWIFKP